LTKFRAAEFFAGIGLVRLALQQEGFDVVFANDIDAGKRALYAANFDASNFVLRDIRQIGGGSVPNVDLATASFPCIDLSIAGNRAGLSGKHSNTFWEFARILAEMGPRRPRAILLENVVGFASARSGEDLASAVRHLNALGYWCGLLLMDAKWFVPKADASVCGGIARTIQRRSAISTIYERDRAVEQFSDA
jgi:DNA (cytosine-5)-methyltransferase 1